MAKPSAPPNWYLKIPPPIWTLAMLVAAYAMQRSFEWAAAVYVSSLPLAIALATAGIGLAVWGARLFAAVGTEIMPTSPANKLLVTDGPFRFTRNPMYLGIALTSLGIAFYMGTLPFFAVPVLVFLLCNGLFIPFEEAKMARQHGAQYTDYLRRVRRWI
jgi:protein-S-isoprenylcysteine O-methyltransferase Ste14